MTVNNDNTAVTPRTSFDDTSAISFDFPGVRIGVAEYDEGPTGCTATLFDKRVLSATDVRGGSPGVFMPDAGGCDAICFSGGSLLGLEAIAGVASEIYAMNAHKPGWEHIPCVQGAILFDMGGPNSIYPDAALGRAAARAAVPGRFPLGRRGAGRSARVGKGLDWQMSEPAGQGAAFAQHGDTKILVLTVVNAIGAIVDRDGNVVRGHLTKRGERIRIEDEFARQLSASRESSAGSPGNTTLTAVITNQRINSRDLQQLARQVHTSMARAIQPFHTINDGDVLFACTTYEVQNDALPVMALGVLASELAWDAVLTSSS
jgi:L-aminopeptidase/D-esterase-like protein